MGHARELPTDRKERVYERERGEGEERKREIHFNLVLFHAIDRALATLLASGLPRKSKGGKRYAPRDEGEKEKGKEKCAC